MTDTEAKTGTKTTMEEKLSDRVRLWVVWWSEYPDEGSEVVEAVTAEGAERTFRDGAGEPLDGEDEPEVEVVPLTLEVLNARTDAEVKEEVAQARREAIEQAAAVVATLPFGGSLAGKHIVEAIRALASDAPKGEAKPRTIESLMSEVKAEVDAMTPEQRDAALAEKVARIGPLGLGPKPAQADAKAPTLLTGQALQDALSSKALLVPPERQEAEDALAMNAFANSERQRTEIERLKAELAEAKRSADAWRAHNDESRARLAAVEKERDSAREARKVTTDRAIAAESRADAAERRVAEMHEALRYIVEEAPTLANAEVCAKAVLHGSAALAAPAQEKGAQSMARCAPHGQIACSDCFRKGVSPKPAQADAKAHRHEMDCPVNCGLENAWAVEKACPVAFCGRAWPCKAHSGMVAPPAPVPPERQEARDPKNWIENDRRDDELSVENERLKAELAEAREDTARVARNRSELIDHLNLRTDERDAAQGEVTRLREALEKARTALGRAMLNTAQVVISAALEAKA